MAINTYNKDFVYDNSRDIFISSSYLENDERSKKAIEKSGLEVKLFFDFIVPPSDDIKLDWLMYCLDNSKLPNELKNRRSRVLKLDEYNELMSWAKDNDKDIFKQSNEFAEVLSAEYESDYLVNILGFPAEKDSCAILKCFTYSPDSIFNIGINVREVFENK